MSAYSSICVSKYGVELVLILPRIYILINLLNFPSASELDEAELELAGIDLEIFSPNF